MSESVYRQWVADLASNGIRPKHELAEEILAYVHHANAAGEPWALEVLTRWEREGSGRDYTNAHKELNSVTYIRRDGRRVKKTTSYSRPKRSTESGEIVGYQMQTWWAMDRTQIGELERDLSNQSAQMADAHTQVRAIAAAMDRHPECDTAADAWVTDGRSLDEIDLSERVA